MEGVCAGRTFLLAERLGVKGPDADTYISGSFCVSMTAAIGIPKFEAGPQKSRE